MRSQNELELEPPSRAPEMQKVGWKEDSRLQAPDGRQVPLPASRSRAQLAPTRRATSGLTGMKQLRDLSSCRPLFLVLFLILRSKNNCSLLFSSIMILHQRGSKKKHICLLSFESFMFFFEPFFFNLGALRVTFYLKEVQILQ